MDKLWNIYTMEYYSAIKRSRLLIDATTCQDLKKMMLNGKKNSLERLHMI